MLWLLYDNKLRIFWPSLEVTVVTFGRGIVGTPFVQVLIGSFAGRGRPAH